MNETVTLATIRWDLIVGGFGLFMFGIKFMGDGLKSFAGDKLRDYIDKYTSKPLMAVLVGAAMTILVQSSAATTAITIGLVRAGLMKLEQAAGIVIGANIGTTFTVFLISMNFGASAMYFVFVGSMIISFCKRKKLRYLGEAILGFGLMFYGLNIMGSALSVIKDLPQFTSIAMALSENPFLSLLAGTVMTAIVHSSAATIGIVQKIYESGGMTFMAVLPFVYGSNIGTTITGIFAAIGGSLTARRTAALHTFFNIIGTIIGMLVLKPFAAFIMFLADNYGVPPMMQIAVTHIMFNVATTVLFFPFLNKMCQLIRKIVPGEEPERIEIKVDEIETIDNSRLPSVSLGIAQSAIYKMSTIVTKMIDDTRQYFINHNADEKDILGQSEVLINSLDEKITNFIMKVNSEDMTEQDHYDANIHLQTVKNLERLGDLCMNLVEFFEMVYDDKGSFSEEASKDVNEMFDILVTMLECTMDIYNNKDYKLYDQLLISESHMDTLEYDGRDRHFARVAKGECVSAVAGSVYCDILATLERMGDHCNNIAKIVIQYGDVEAMQPDAE